MSKFGWCNYIRRDGRKVKGEITQPHEAESQEKRSVVNGTRNGGGITKATKKRGRKIDTIIHGGGREKEGEISKLNYFLPWYLFKVVNEKKKRKKVRISFFSPTE